MIHSQNFHSRSRIRIRGPMFPGVFSFASQIFCARSPFYCTTYFYYRTTINTNASSSAGHGGFLLPPGPRRNRLWRSRPPPSACSTFAFALWLCRRRSAKNAGALVVLGRQRNRASRPSVRAHSPHSEWTLPRASSVRDSLSRSAREDGERSAGTSNSNRKQHKNKR